MNDNPPPRYCWMINLLPVVCERLSAMHYHIPVSRIFGPKFLECPSSSISGILSGVPPSPPKMKIWSGLGTWNLSWSAVSRPSPPKMEILSGLFTLDLSWSRVPPSKGLCGSWCVEANCSIPHCCIHRLVFICLYFVNNYHLVAWFISVHTEQQIWPGTNMG